MWVNCLGYMRGWDGCFSGGKDLTSGRLGESSAESSLPSLFFGWHFVCVLSGSQIVGANVGTQ
jgi:hypothetical protein